MRDANLGESTGCLGWATAVVTLVALLSGFYFIHKRIEGVETKLEEVYRSHFKYEPIPWEEKDA